MKITKKCICTEGKLLPAIPIPGKTIDDYPDCPECNGNGWIEVEGKDVRRGKRYKQARMVNQVSLRSFCKQFDLDPVKVSRVERGLDSADEYLKQAYESINEV